MLRSEFSVANLPNIAEDEVYNNSYHSDHLEIELRSDLEVESFSEILRLVERHEDDGGAGRDCPGPHDH